MEKNRCFFARSAGSGLTAGRVVGWTLAGLVVAVVFALVFGILVRLLWGYALTPLLGLPQPTYLQAVAIILLARLVFGSPGHGRHWDKRNGFAARRPAGRRPWGRRDAAGDLEAHIRATEGDHYERFWETEGRRAFEDYLKRIDAGPFRNPGPARQPD